MTEYDLLNEIGTGIVACLLTMLTAGLGHYIYTHRVTLTVADRDARFAAIGLATVFGAMAFRGLVLWLTFVQTREGWPFPAVPLDSPVVFGVTLGIAILGAGLTVRAFHPWPIWAVLITASILIPVLIAFA